MSNALTLFDQPKVNVPAHIADMFGGEGNIGERQTVPSLSYEGKVWSLNVNGEKKRLMKTDENGDETPVPVMRVVVLDYAKRRGRTYYEGAYDPQKPGTPLCWSEDGVTPHANVQQPKGAKCETCPMSVKGSKITEQGKAIAACSQHRMIAVVPANNLSFTPLRMKLAITSDWDKNPELISQGWFGFNNLLDELRNKRVPHTAAFVTKMRFDPSVPFPKVIFSPDRWLTDDELAVVAPISKSDAVKNLLGGTFTPNGSDGMRMDQAKWALEEKPAAPQPPAKPTLSVVSNEDDGDDDGEIVAPPKVVQKAAPKAAPITIDMDDDDGEIAPPPKKVAKVVPKKVEQDVVAPKAKAAPAVSDDVASLLEEWGD
jgi:hypothetical protein